MNQRFETAKARYEAVGVDVEKAMKEAGRITLSMHCWQGDDVRGFDQKGPLSGGIQTTGNYPYSARTPEELFQDIEKVLSYVPGKQHKLNLHACYAIFEDGEWADRNRLEPKHFKKWVELAKKNGLDFNPTFFSHPLAESATLSSENEEVRKFWIQHAKRAWHMLRRLRQKVLWLTDGMSI